MKPGDRVTAMNERLASMGIPSGSPGIIHLSYTHPEPVWHVFFYTLDNDCLSYERDLKDAPWTLDNFTAARDKKALPAKHLRLVLENYDFTDEFIGGISGTRRPSKSSAG